ncbi:hypothetical protein GAMM_60253 [Gammaproteobacteria bacterium]
MLFGCTIQRISENEVILNWLRILDEMTSLGMPESYRVA